jgi:signal transduction histidine kinase
VTKFRVLGFGLALALAASPALADKYGSPAEAKALLEKVAAEMKANQAGTLEKINKGEYKKDDLYPFCGGPDGKYSAQGANASMVGQSLKDLKDKAGKAIGEEFYKEAQAGKLAEVSYMWPRPGETEPVQKVSYVTKIGDQICGVGYYKQS